MSLKTIKEQLKILTDGVVADEPGILVVFSDNYYEDYEGDEEDRPVKPAQSEIDAASQVIRIGFE